MHRASLSISKINRVRQIISSDRLISEFEVSAGTIPFLASLPVPRALRYSGGLPFSITGAIVSSADIVDKRSDTMELLMDTVDIKGSNIPGLRQMFDSGLKLQSRGLSKFLSDSFPSTYSVPKPVFRITYVDEDIRISRDQDNKVFVYSKVSDEAAQTDYGETPSDFGITNLIKGLSILIPQL